jgi:hypothetical protein
MKNQNTETTYQQQWPYRFYWAEHLLCLRVVEADLKHYFVFMKQCYSEFTTTQVHEPRKLLKKYVFTYDLTKMINVLVKVG